MKTIASNFAHSWTPANYGGDILRVEDKQEPVV
jgi:hypothetical protein